MVERTRPWSGWPAPALGAWLVGRALCTAAAAIAPWFTVGWSRALPVTLAVLVLRPVARWSFGLVLAVGVGAVVPASGVFLLARLALGEVVLRGLGRAAPVPGMPDVPAARTGRRRAGLDRVRATRHQLLVRWDMARPEEPDAETAWVLLQGHLRTRLAAPERRSDAFELEDRVLTCLVVAWCHADIVVLARAMRRVTAGILLGRWEGVDRLVPDDDQEMLRMAPLVVVEAIPRAVAVIAAALGPWFLVDGEAFSVGPVTVGARLVAALLGGSVALWQTSRPPSRAMSVVAVGLAALVLGRPALVVGAVGYVAGLGVWAGRRWAEGLMIAGPRPAPNPRTLGRRDTGLALHGHWRASEMAMAAGRPGIAISILHGLAHEASLSRPLVAAAAHARLGILELRRGRVQRAADGANAALQLVTASVGGGWGRWRWRRTEALARADMTQVRYELGQEVVDLLPDLRHLPARWPEAREARRVCVDALTRAGRADEALQLIARSHQGVRGARDMLTGIDSQVAAAQTLVAAGEGKAALAYLIDEVQPRIDQIVKSVLTEDDPLDDIHMRVVVASGRCRLLVGQLELERGQASDALAAFEQAAVRLRPAGAPTLLITAHVLEGVALTRLRRWSDAVDAIDAGVGALEAQRRQLTSGDARTQAIVSAERLYRAALDALHDAQHQGGEERAGVVAATLVEALHQSALADALRSAQFDLAPGHDELAVAFARAYRPREVDLDELRATCGPGHALSYYYCPAEGGPTGYCVWLPPEGAPVIHRVEVDRPDALELLAFLGGHAAVEPLCLRRRVRSPAHGAMWAALARSLFPPALLAHLRGLDADCAAHIVVVPDGPLARLPWAALLVDEARTLVEVGVVQLVPALELLDPTTPPAGAGRGERRSGGDRERVVFHADPGLMDAAVSAALVHDLDGAHPGVQLVACPSYDDVVAALHDPSSTGVFFAAHGVGRGLEQQVQLGDGRLLSTSEALGDGLRWPEWVFFGACFVGSVEQRLGGEPLGLPIVCLLGGARTVIGGTVEVEDPRTDLLSRVTLVALGEGTSPAEALRRGQLDLVGAKVNGWAAFTCISRVPPGRARSRTITEPGAGTGTVAVRAPVSVPVPAPADDVATPAHVVAPPTAVEPSPAAQVPVVQAAPPPSTRGGARAWAPIEPGAPGPVTTGPPATVSSSPPAGRPARGSLRERWDWPRVKATLLCVGVGYYTLLLFQATVSATREDGVMAGLVLLGLTGIGAFYTRRHFRRARRAQGAAERRRARRRSTTEHHRNIIARSSARALAARPVHSTALVEVLHRARAAAADEVVTRRQVAAALGPDFRLPEELADAVDAGDQVVVRIDGPSDDIVMASEELSACLAMATRLAWSYAINEVERAHLATTLVHSVTGDVEDARRRLRGYFGGDEFDGLAGVLAAGPEGDPGDARAIVQATPEGHRAEEPSPDAVEDAPTETLLRFGYLLGALVLLGFVTQMFTDLPGRLAETRDVRQASEALDAGRDDEAFRLFSEVAERVPDSITAHRGRACAAARGGELDLWALSENEAVLVGMGLAQVGACLDPAARRRFRVVVVENIALVVPSSASDPDDRDTGIAGRLAIVRSDRQLVDVVAGASCAAGAEGLPLYAQHLARSALRIARYAMDGSDGAAIALRACIGGWPPGEARDAVTGWVVEP